VLSLKSGLGGADSRAVQVRVNNINLANNGPQTYGGMYAANEVVNSDWAEHWLPADSSGNIYRALRDIPPRILFIGAPITLPTSTRGSSNPTPARIIGATSSACCASWAAMIFSRLNLRAVSSMSNNG